jgi:transposase
MALREKLPIREIARRTGLSRNTIKKYLNAGTIEPRFATPERPSKLDPFAKRLAAWLKTQAGKSRKQRRTQDDPACSVGWNIGSGGDREPAIGIGRHR